jgi:hypothetical protein
MLKRLKSNGSLNKEYARQDPDLNCLHGDSEFEELVA